MKASTKCIETLTQWKNEYDILDIEDTEACEQYFNNLKNTYFSFVEEKEKAGNAKTAERMAHDVTVVFREMLNILAKYIYEAKYVPEKVSFMMATNVMKTLHNETDISQEIQQQLELFTGFIISIQYDIDDDVARFVYHHEVETDAIHEYVHELYEGNPEYKEFEAEDEFPLDEHKMA